MNSFQLSAAAWEGIFVLSLITSSTMGSSPVSAPSSWVLPDRNLILTYLQLDFRVPPRHEVMILGIPIRAAGLRSHRFLRAFISRNVGSDAGLRASLMMVVIIIIIIVATIIIIIITIIIAINTVATTRNASPRRCLEIAKTWKGGSSSSCYCEPPCRPCGLSGVSTLSSDAAQTLAYLQPQGQTSKGEIGVGRHFHKLLYASILSLTSTCSFLWVVRRRVDGAMCRVLWANRCTAASDMSEPCIPSSGFNASKLQKLVLSC